MFTRYDRLLIYFFILMAVFSFAISGYMIKTRGEDKAKVIVSVAGKTQTFYPLDKDGQVKVEGPLGISTVEISSAYGVRMLDSPCPQKICLAHGWVKRGGQVIVCVPNKVVVRITEGDKLKVDAVSE